jgi:hypothetical protein
VFPLAQNVKMVVLSVATWSLCCHISQIVLWLRRQFVGMQSGKVRKELWRESL